LKTVAAFVRGGRATPRPEQEQRSAMLEEKGSMNRQLKLICASIVLAFAIAGTGPAMALTMKECSAKYKEAQKAGTLKGMKWNDFRKAECGATAKPAAATTPAKPAKPEKMTKKPMAAPMHAGSAVFPRAVSPKYAKESPGKARMHTCLDQYKANKATNANGGLKWIQKGGGYYSECNKRLKS
jgi:hypothetical protein